SENPHFERSRATSCRCWGFDTGTESRVPQRRVRGCPHTRAPAFLADHLQRSTRRTVDGAIRATVRIRQQARNRDAHYRSTPAPTLSAPTRANDSLRHLAW